MVSERWRRSGLLSVTARWWVSAPSTRRSGATTSTHLWRRTSPPVSNRLSSQASMFSSQATPTGPSPSTTLAISLPTCCGRAVPRRSSPDRCRTSSRSPGHAHPLPTATMLPANSPLRRPRMNEWSSLAAPTGSKVLRTKPPSRQVATPSRSSPTASTGLTLLATATYSNAWPMSGFSSARCRLAQFRHGIGSSLAGD